MAKKSGTGDVHGHFSTVAGVYRDVRTTDEEPIRVIRGALAGRAAIRGADIGCGAGRYDYLLFRHLPDLHLTCIDMNPEMLAELSRHLRGNGIENFETLVASVEDLQLIDQSLDCIFSFNAVHHFDFPTFLNKIGGTMKKDGRTFVYTRTPGQNSRSIWGKHFPDFCEKERRLFKLETMKRWIDATERLTLIDARTFRYPRTASLRRLLEQARSKHYSTFSLYRPGEFDAACETFADNIRRHFDDPMKVEWHDENILLQMAPDDDRKSRTR